jgi:hypothetical protein
VFNRTGILIMCNKRKIICIGFVVFLSIQLCKAEDGPPFLTDDPQPVQFRHWEYYVSSVGTFQQKTWSGTLPHFEVNYGIIKNIQIHLLLPVNFNYIQHEGARIGYTDTEFGIKYCFVQETENRPQVGTFPIVEIPTIKNSEFGNGKAQFFIPLWVQKSWNRLTSYGGVGYLISPGKDKKNSVFAGYEIQYDISPLITMGGELYYHTPDESQGKSVFAFNVGGYLNMSSNAHILFSVGHSLANQSFISSYIGFLWTI